MALAVGGHANISVSNVLIEAVNADQSAVLVKLPDNGSGIPVEWWIPANDSRVVITQSVPPNWPPVEGDLWIVPGVSQPALVVSGGGTTLYFITPDEVRTAYTSTTLPVKPPLTVNDALAAYGTSLTLQFRQPTG